MLFENDNQTGFDNNMDLGFIGIFSNENFDNSPELFNPEEAFNLGNSFKNLYDPYKDFKPLKLHAVTEKEKLMYQIYMYDFILNDLNLYLDLNPDDIEIFNRFKQYCLEYKKYLNMYEEKYGPLCLTNPTDSYKWLRDPWPWNDSRRDMYV